MCPRSLRLGYKTAAGRMKTGPGVRAQDTGFSIQSRQWSARLKKLMIIFL
jgi:hypothetical protein